MLVPVPFFGNQNRTITGGWFPRRSLARGYVTGRRSDQLHARKRRSPGQLNSGGAIKPRSLSLDHLCHRGSPTARVLQCLTDDNSSVITSTLSEDLSDPATPSRFQHAKLERWT